MRKIIFSLFTIFFLVSFIIPKSHANQRGSPPPTPPKGGETHRAVAPLRLPPPSRAEAALAGEGPKGGESQRSIQPRGERPIAQDTPEKIVVQNFTARFLNNPPAFRLTQRRPGGPGHPLRIRINRITKLFFKKKGRASLIGGRNKRITAAILSFPLPLGILGVHRLYLGTQPIVPIIYIVTLGGGLGILPFIDFVVLLLADDIERFEDNPHVFMWTND